MSKYTTEVRFYCEHLAGYDESQDYDKIDEIVTTAAPKIFQNFPIFDEGYRLTLECKILKHYYVREICAETPGLWKLWLNNRMNEIMPYYNELYKTAEMKFDPFHDVDITIQHQAEGTKEGTTTQEQESSGKDKSTITGSNSVSGSSTSESNSSTSASAKSDTESHNTESGRNEDRYSDTPQGTVDADLSTYLTNARNINVNNSNDGTASSTSSEESDSSGTNTTSNKQESSNQSTTESTTGNSSSGSGTENINTTDKFIETRKGKQGTASYSFLLKEYRDTLINIDMMIIDELSDLFFNIY